MSGYCEKCGNTDCICKEIPATKPCPECNGADICGTCAGSGEGATERSKCAACGGSGAYECETCGGAGVVEVDE